MARVGEIYWFQDYVFTDTKVSKGHFALTLLSKHWNYENSSIFSVVTSKQPKDSYYTQLPHDKYNCFSKPTFARFIKNDLLPIEEGKTFLKAELDFKDTKNSLNMIIRCIQHKRPEYGDQFLRGAILREWKKRREELRPS